MSESDSDLDYASADEDASCDVNAKNSNLHKMNHGDVNNHSSAFSGEPPEIMTSVSEEPDKKVCNDNLKGDHINIENSEVAEAHDTDSCDHVNKLSSDGDGSKSERSEDALDKLVEEKYTKDDNNDYEISKINHLDKPINKGIKEESNNKTIQNSNIEPEGAPIKGNEKQRVPLRLEKKIQQKQQASKEDTAVSDETKATKVLFKQPEVKSSSSWGFGSWGTNLLSTAASSVSTFTNQVSQGIGTVLETVENTLGAPSPEELAVAFKTKKESSDSSVNKVEEKDNTNIESQEENTAEVKSGILPNVTSWTKVFEDTGSKVLMGGLDTLELIGKKTIDIITEGDPGLRKKRAAFSEGITLSQLLREAKAEADESKQDEDPDKETVHYSQMFDEYQGLVHLEALEMLSKQSEAKIQMLVIRLPRNSDVRKKLEEIKSICENIPQLDDPAAYEDFEDFLTLCKKYVLELNITFNVENIIKAQKRISDVLENYENATVTTSTPEEIYHSAICSLAEFTAKSIEVFHKITELILVQPSLEPNVEHFATNLTGLTTVMCIEINKMSSRYHHCLDSISEQCENGSSQKSNITTVVTNLYLEAENSNKYIQDAFMLLIPVLQTCHLESSQ